MDNKQEITKLNAEELDNVAAGSLGDTVLGGISVTIGVPVGGTFTGMPVDRFPGTLLETTVGESVSSITPEQLEDAINRLTKESE